MRPWPWRNWESLDWGRIHIQQTGALVEQWVAQRGGQGKAIAQEELDPQLATRIYQRVYPGPLDISAELARLPLTRRLEWAEFARKEGVGLGYTNFLLYWLDGERPLGEVLKMVKLESGAWKPLFALGYLKLCLELGLVRLKG